MIKLFEEKDIKDLIDKSHISKRKRAVAIIHPAEKKGYRIIVNCIQPDSYMQPHKHMNHNAYENWIILQGKILIILFNEKGNILDGKILSHSASRMVDIQPNVYHTAISLEKDSIMYEISDGPYDALKYKKFASWAPSEKDNNYHNYLTALKRFIEN